MQSLGHFFQVESYILSFDLNHKKHHFNGLATIQGTVNPDWHQIKLNAVGLEINTVKVNGQDGNFEYDDKILTIHDITNQVVKLEISFKGPISKQMYGIYRCTYQEAGKNKEIIATQFESHYARYAFPCIDEPSAKANFQLNIVGDADLTVLSNMPVLKQLKKRSRQLVKFANSPKMSPYTLAFVVGDLVKIEALTSSGVQIAAYASSAHQVKELEFGLKVAAEAMDWYETYFGVAYPLPKCDHVALPDFAAGAMENWGLVTYREALFLTQNNTPIDIQETIATVITHELAHMWFGNLVTMPWWDELWLNESLASIFENKCLAAICPEFKPELNFYTQTLYTALKRDSLLGVQPILMPINSPEEINTAFDGAIVYAKGACLMQMLLDYIGEDQFRQALSLFLRKYQFGCPSGSHLLRCFDQVSQQNISQIMQNWLRQAGYPRIVVTEEPQQFAVYQTDFIEERSAQKWTVPLQINQQQTLLEQQILTYKELPIVNQGAGAYVLVDYQVKDQHALLAKLQNVEKNDQYYFLTCQLILASKNQVRLAQLIPYLVDFGQNNTSYLVWLALARFIQILTSVLENQTNARQQLANQFTIASQTALELVGFQSKQEESIEQHKLRQILIELGLELELEAYINPLSRDFNQDLAKIPAARRAQIMAAQVILKPSAQLVNTLFKNYTQTLNPDLKSDICYALCQAKEDSIIKQILSQLLLDQIIKAQDILSWFAYLMRNRQARRQTWAWLKSNFSQLIDLFADSGDYADFIRVSGACLNQPEELNDFQQFFANYQTKVSMKLEIEVGIKQIKQKIDLIARNQADLERELTRQNSSHNNSST